MLFQKIFCLNEICPSSQIFANFWHSKLFFEDVNLCSCCLWWDLNHSLWDQHLSDSSSWLGGMTYLEDDALCDSDGTGKHGVDREEHIIGHHRDNSSGVPTKIVILNRLVMILCRGYSNYLRKKNFFFLHFHTCIEAIQNSATL